MPVVSVPAANRCPYIRNETETDYALAVFPGLDESIDSKDYTNALRWVDIIENSIKHATGNLKSHH